MSVLLSWIVFGLVALAAIGVYLLASVWLDREERRSR